MPPVAPVNREIPLRSLVADDEHKHHCSKCNTTWAHKDDLDHLSDEEYEKVHDCPTCGTVVTMKVMDEQQTAKRMRAIEALAEIFLGKR